MFLPMDREALATNRDDTAHPPPERSVIIPTIIAIRYYTLTAAGHGPDTAMYLVMQNHYAPALRRALVAEARTHAANEHYQELLDARNRFIAILQRRARARRSPRRYLARLWRGVRRRWCRHWQVLLAAGLMTALFFLPHLVGR